MKEQTEDDGIIRYGYRNIRGSYLEHSLETATEINMMLELGTNVQGLSEINGPWTKENKSHYDHMMSSLFDNPRTVYSSAPSAIPSRRYQHGGTLLSLTGSVAGQIKSQGATSGAVTAGPLQEENEMRGSSQQRDTESARMNRATKAPLRHTNSSTI